MGKQLLFSTCIMKSLLCRRAPSALALTALAGWSLFAGARVHGADGTIYYNRTANASSAPAVRAIRADGSNDRPIPIALPFAAHPTVSRDGRHLLVTSADPVLFGQMISQNVFRVDLATGATTPITHFVDTLSDGVVTYINLFNEPDFDTYSYYTSHLPNFKAFSPAGDRVASLSLTSVSGKEPGGVRMPPTQSPLLEVYPVQQTSPLGEFLFAGAERTGLNQAGDGVDWHPTRNELVGPFRQDIPATNNLGAPGLTEGTVVKVYNATGLNPFVRNLTAPTGSTYYDFNTFFIVSTTAQDYAPAISRDGGRVAYVRNTLVSDSRVGFGFELASSSLRIINYDGTGDRELLRFGPGVWLTKLAWSPDDTEIAYDAAPQLVVDGLKLQMADVLRSEIQVVKVSDQSFRLLAPAPASFPTWSPLTSNPTALPDPEIRISRAGNQFNLSLSSLVIGRQYDVESSTNLAQWTTPQSFTATAATRTILITPAPQTRAAFYRLKMR
jgi:hypothetical protein